MADNSCDFLPILSNLVARRTVTYKLRNPGLLDLERKVAVSPQARRLFHEGDSMVLGPDDLLWIIR